jgi:hypothetical protein
MREPRWKIGAIIRVYFEKQLDGRTVPFEDLVLEERKCLFHEASVLGDFSLDLECIPSLPSITRAHSAIKPLKGIGENAIGGEAYKLLPLETSKLLHPLHVKAAAQISYPIQWAGGQLHTLWKSKGSQSLISNHRDITLTCQDAKVAGRYLRKHLVPAAANMNCDTQMGSGFMEVPRMLLICFARRRLPLLLYVTCPLLRFSLMPSVPSHLFNAELLFLEVAHQKTFGSNT